MSRLPYFSPEQPEKIRPYFPLSHGVARVDDLKVISGIPGTLKAESDTNF